MGMPSNLQAKGVTKLCRDGHSRTRISAMIIFGVPEAYSGEQKYYGNESLHNGFNAGDFKMCRRSSEKSDCAGRWSGKARTDHRLDFSAAGLRGRLAAESKDRQLR